MIKGYYTLLARKLFSRQEGIKGVKRKYYSLYKIQHVIMDIEAKYVNLI
jgi:hypothetical protein